MAGGVGGSGFVVHVLGSSIGAGVGAHDWNEDYDGRACGAVLRPAYKA